METVSLESSIAIPTDGQTDTTPMTRIAEDSITTREMKELADRIVKLRKERGITQVDLAAALGVTQPMVSRFEGGEFRISSDALIKLAKLLAVTSDELLGLKTSALDGTKTISRRWLKRLVKIEKLPKRDQDGLIQTVDRYLKASGTI